MPGNLTRESKLTECWRLEGRGCWAPPQRAREQALEVGVQPLGPTHPQHGPCECPMRPAGQAQGWILSEHSAGLLLLERRGESHRFS